MNESIISICRALFGYEGQSNDLKVVETGDGGLAELASELNEGKIQYAFVRVIDPNTSLTKFVLINWQGEGAQTLRKGLCSKHFRDISALLNGHHITIAASNEEDVEEERIIQKLAQNSSEYNFKDRAKTVNDERVAVGTNYTRVIPSREIDPVKRDLFWKKEEEQESGRKVMEFERQKLENLKIEEERRMREEREHQKRELLNKEPPKVASPVVVAVKKPVPQPAVVEKSESVIPKAEQLRLERRKEAQELIGISKVNATKALFMQNVSTPIQSPPSVQKKHEAPAKPIRKTIQKQPENSIPSESSVVSIPEIPVPVIMNVVEPEIPVEPENPEPIIELQTHKSQSAHLELELDQEDQFSTIKRSPYSNSKTNTPVTPPEADSVIANVNVVDNNLQYESNNNNNNMSSNVESPIKQQQIIDDEEQYFMSDSGLKARALYDYQAGESSLLSITS